MTLNKQFRTLFFIKKLCVCNRKCAAALIVQSLKHEVLPFLFFICKIRLTSLHLICFVITRMVLCWFISLSFCAALWKPHSFLTVIYNYHQRQVIFLPWSILLHIYAIVFIMISGKQMEGFLCIWSWWRTFGAFRGWEHYPAPGSGCTPWPDCTSKQDQSRHCPLSSPYQVSVLSYEELWPHSIKSATANSSRCIYFNNQGANSMKHVMECISPAF